MRYRRPLRLVAFTSGCRLMPGKELVLVEVTLNYLDMRSGRILACGTRNCWISHSLRWQVFMKLVFGLFRDCFRVLCLAWSITWNMSHILGVHRLGLEVLLLSFTRIWGNRVGRGEMWW